MTIPRSCTFNYYNGMDNSKTLKRNSRKNKLLTTTKNIFSFGKENLGQTYKQSTTQIRNPLSPLPIYESNGQSTPINLHRSKYNDWCEESTPITSCITYEMDSQKKSMFDTYSEELNQATFRASQVC